MGFYLGSTNDLYHCCDRPDFSRERKAQPRKGESKLRQGAVEGAWGYEGEGGDENVKDGVEERKSGRVVFRGEGVPRRLEHARPTRRSVAWTDKTVAESVMEEEVEDYDIVTAAGGSKAMRAGNRDRGGREVRRPGPERRGNKIGGIARMARDGGEAEACQREMGTLEAIDGGGTQKDEAGNAAGQGWYGGGGQGRESLANMCGYPLSAEEVKMVRWSRPGEVVVGQLVAVRRNNGRVVKGLVHDLVGGSQGGLVDVTVQSTRGPGLGGGRLRKVVAHHLVGHLPENLAAGSSSAQYRAAEHAAQAQTHGTVEDAKERLLREALRRQPSDVRAHCELGHLCHLRNALKEAETHFRAALEIEPDDHVTLMRYGRLLMVLGDGEYACRLFRKAGVAISFGKTGGSGTGGTLTEHSLQSIGISGNLFAHSAQRAPSAGTKNGERVGNKGALDGWSEAGSAGSRVEIEERWAHPSDLATSFGARDIAGGEERSFPIGEAM